MADRPRYYCRDCSYQWLPRGTERATQCPGCRGPNVAAVLSLDDAAPPPPARRSAPTPHPDRRPRPPGAEPAAPSVLPLVLAVVGILGVGVVTAGGLAIYLLRDPAPKPTEVAAAKANPPAPAPEPKVTPKTPEPEPEPSKSSVKPKTVPVPVEPEPKMPDPTPPEPAPKTPEPTPVPEPAPKTPEPAPKPPEPAPKPPTVVERPPSPFPPPPKSWESKWEKAGDVRIRVVGVAESKVPLVARKRNFLSPESYFVVWVEVENTGKANLTYRRWQPVATGECTLKYAAGGVLGHAIYPADAGREWFTEFAQPLPPGGPPALESLVFSRPDTTADGPLTLTLDATRAGGVGRVAIDIPRTAWARK
ncbi:hypothetical protein [Urbifossiella limnaea]|uniref:IgA FC receptor n=1 Tax=Urbifossiella limnaea TaxID=2528023 RepID=A0A517XZY1_9BACT|nr:hypothetical protein [Urbifossiella limnaea]QDU23069.1 IgA FC receptor precursor [Urbifossiella limnaea]